MIEEDHEDPRESTAWLLEVRAVKCAANPANERNLDLILYTGLNQIPIKRLPS